MSPQITQRSRRRWSALRGIWMLLSIGLLVGLFAAPSGAEDITPQMELRAVDARDGQVAIDVMGAPDTKTVTVQTGDKTVRPTSVTPLSELGEGADVEVVIDNSAAVGNGAVQFTKDALSELEPSDHGPIDGIGAVTTGGSASLVSRPTGSLGSLTDKLSTLGPVAGNSLWPAVEKAANAFASPGAQNAIVIVTGSPAAATSVRQSDAMAAIRDSGASVHVIALAGGSADTEALQQMVETAGGSMQVVPSEELDHAFGVVGRQLASLTRIVVPSKVAANGADMVPLTVTVGDQSVDGAYQPDEVLYGLDALQPLEEPGLIDNFFASSMAQWLIIALVAASAGMIVYAAAMLVIRRNEGLDFALRHYEAYSVDDASSQLEDDDGSYAKGAVLKKAVAITGDFAQRQGFLTRVEELLEQADLPLRPAEAVFFYAAIVVATTLIFGALSRNIFVVAAVLLTAILLPKYVVQFKGSRRRKKFVAQLPDMLQLLSGTLRAGYSVGQGFEAVSQEIEDPMGKELRRVMTEARLGRPLEEALENAAERMKSDDFTWAIMAIRIQREVGGNLAELLMTVAETMTQRERLRRDVNSLTAEGRMSAIILGLLPPGLALAMWVMNPQYIGRLTTDSMGIALLIAACVMMLVGFVWMKKIIKIEI